MVIWNRLKYLLSPQFDIYEQAAEIVHGRVADIGFGTGFGTHLLSKNADTVMGYEIDSAAIGFARSVFPLNGLDFQYGDIRNGVTATSGYDFVVMIDVIEHIENDAGALENARALLCTGGVLILSTPNRLCRYRKSDNHVREYSPDELKSVLSKFFATVSLRQYGFKPMASQYQNPLIAVCGGGDQ